MTRRATYRIRGRLDFIEPEIWRLLEVPADLPLIRVHDVLQVAFGWQNSHLHAFTATDGRRWLDETSLDEDMDGRDEASATLADVLTEDLTPLQYDYDFGDGWQHTIDLIEIIDEEQPAPRLIRAERAGPPEDSGGPGGYEDLLRVIADPTDPAHERLREWALARGGPWAEPFDPERVNVELINAQLALRFAPEPPPGWGTALRALMARMRPPLAAFFGDYLVRADLDRPVLIDASSASAAVRPYRWLLGRCDDTGVRLTSAGRLPPSLVVEAMTAFGWSEGWYGKANREDHARPVAALRESATRLGLVRKSRGVLSATASARRIGTDDVALLRFLAGRWLGRARSEFGSDAAVLLAVELATGVRTRDGEILDAVAYGLDLVGWRDSRTGESIAGHGLYRELRDDIAMLRILSGATDWLALDPGLAGRVGREFGRLALLAS